MRDLDLNQLNSFRHVAELGTFSGAATRLGITQPAVSHHIRELERRLGTRLLERTAKRSLLTAAGEELLRHLPAIEAAVEAAWEGVSEHSEGRVGRVRIGTGATASIYFLPPVLGRLKQRYPGIAITVVTGTTNDVVRLLHGNEIDLGLVTMPCRSEGITVSPLLEDDYVGVVPAADSSVPATLTPEWLADRPLILYEPGGSTRFVVDQWFHAAGITPTPTMNLGNVEAIKELVRAGLGYSVLPGMAFRRDTVRSRGTARPLDPPLARTLGLAMRSDKPLGKALRETVRELEKARSGPTDSAATPATC